MKPPRFWAGDPDHPAARLLAPLGALYGARVAERMDRPGEWAGLPVICLGNFTLGGAGKTPAALAIATMLRDLGHRPAFLSRGYGGRCPGPVAVDLKLHTSREVGDEPLLLARAATTVVSRDRPAGARLCASLGADIVVMDDGLQNPSLCKDISLAVVDAGAGIGNGLPFPAGPLRAPLARQWPHVGGLICVGEGEPGERVAAEARTRGLTVHRARLVPEASNLAGRRVLAFAGVGRPEKFFATLRALGAEVVQTRGFPDHHAYRARDLAGLRREAQRLGARLVTTEKDAVRLSREDAAGIRTLPVRLRFEDEAAVRESLRAVLSTGRP